MARKKLGDLLRGAGLIDEIQLTAALGHQRQWGGRLGGILVQLKMVGEEELLQAISHQLGLPTVNLAASSIAEDVIQLVPREFCERHQLLPWTRTRNDRGAETVHVAMSDPTNLAIVDELSFLTGKRIEVAVASDRDIELAIRRHFYGESAEDQAPRTAHTASAAFAGAEYDLAGGGGMMLVEPVAHARLDSGLGPDAIRLDRDRAEERLPQRQPVIYRETGHPPDRQVAGGDASPPLSLRERMLLQTLEADLGAEGVLEDRRLLLALARLLIRKGVIDEDEWIAEIARR